MGLFDDIKKGFTSVTKIFSGGIKAIGEIALNVGLALVAGALLKPKVKAQGQKGLQTTVQSAVEPRTIIYGETRVSGPYVLLEESNIDDKDDAEKTNKWLNIVIPIATHPVEEITTLYLDGNPLDLRGVYNKYYPGTDNVDYADYYKPNIAASPDYRGSLVRYIMGSNGGYTAFKNSGWFAAEGWSAEEVASAKKRYDYLYRKNVVCIPVTGKWIDKAHSQGGNTWSNLYNDEDFIRSEEIRKTIQRPGEDYTYATVGGSVDTTTKPWNFNHRLERCSYVYVRLKYDKESTSGIPNVSVKVKGKRLYNPLADPNIYSPGNRGAYSGGTTYYVGDVITDGNGYVCIKQGSGQTPASSPDYWVERTHELVDYDNDSYGEQLRKESTHEYSNNWALCVLDYLLDKYYGVKVSTSGQVVELNWDAICNAVLDSYDGGYLFRPFGQAPSREANFLDYVDVNGGIKVDRTPLDILETLLGAGLGELAYSQGEHHLFANVYREPDGDPTAGSAIIFDESYLADGGLNVSTAFSTSDLYNTVTGTYVQKVNPKNNRETYDIVEFDTIRNTTYIAQDKEELPYEVSFPFTQDKQQAEKLATVLLEKPRRGYIIDANCNIKAWKFKVGDIIYVSNDRLGLDDTIQFSYTVDNTSPYTTSYKQFKIINMKYNENNTIDVTMQENDMGLYNPDTAYANDPVPNTGDLYIPGTGTEANPPTNLVATNIERTEPSGAITTLVRLTFDGPNKKPASPDWETGHNYDYIALYRIKYAKSSQTTLPGDWDIDGDPWSYVTLIANTEFDLTSGINAAVQQQDLFDLEPGETYDIAVQAVPRSGVPSTWSDATITAHSTATFNSILITDVQNNENGAGYVSFDITYSGVSPYDNLQTVNIYYDYSSPYSFAGATLEKFAAPKDDPSPLRIYFPTDQTIEGRFWFELIDTAGQISNRYPAGDTGISATAPDATAGADGVSAFLTRSSVTIPCDNTGTPISGAFDQANGNMKVYEGGIDKTSEWTFTEDSETNCTGTVTSGGAYSVTAISADTASYNIRGSKSGFTDVLCNFTLSKSLSGAPGDPGDPAPVDVGDNLLEHFEYADTTALLAAWEDLAISPATATVTLQSTGGTTGGKVMQVAGDQARMLFTELLAFDPTTTYKMSVRIRRTAGSTNHLIRLGIAGVAENGTDYVNTSGSNSTSNQHYFVANSYNLASDTLNEWVDLIGYWRGVDTTGDSGTNNDPFDPGVCHTDVRYMKPLLEVNITDGTGTVQIDSVRVQPAIVAEVGDWDFGIQQNSAGAYSNRLRFFPDGDNPTVEKARIELFSGNSLVQIKNLVSTGNVNLSTTDNGEVSLTSNGKDFTYQDGNANIPGDLTVNKLNVDVNGINFIGTGTQSILFDNTPSPNSYEIEQDGVTDSLTFKRNAATIFEFTGASATFSNNLDIDGILDANNSIRVTSGSFQLAYDQTYGEASIASILSLSADNGFINIGPSGGYTNSAGGGQYPSGYQFYQDNANDGLVLLDGTNTRYTVITDDNTPSLNQHLRYSTTAGAWTPTAAPSFGNLSDSSISAPGEFAGIHWDNGLSKWIDYDPRYFRRILRWNSPSDGVVAPANSSISAEGGTLYLEEGANVTLTFDDANDKITIASSAGGGGTVTSVDITPGTLIDSSGGPITTSGSITVDVDLSEATEAVYTPSTDYLLFLDGGTTGTAAKESGVDFASALAGTGLTASSGVINRDIIALTTDTSGDYVATITGGTGIDSSGATSGEGISHTLSIDLGEVSAVVFNPATDYIPIIDGSATGSTQKDSWTDIANAIAGTGITASSGVLNADNLGTVTSVDIIAGTLIDSSGGPITGSGAISVNVDLSEATELPFTPSTDYVLFLDGGATGTAAKESWADLANSIAGTGISASSGVLNADLTGTGVNNRVTLWSGTNSLDSSANLTFDGSLLTVEGEIRVTGVGASYDFEYDPTYGTASIAEILEYASGELRIGPTSGFTDSGGAGNIPTQTRLTSGTNHTDFFVYDPTSPATTRYVLKTSISSPPDEAILAWENSTDSVKFLTPSNSVQSSGGFLQLVNDEGVPDAYDFYGYNGVSKGWHEIKAFKTFTVTDTDSGYTWSETGSAVASTTTDTITLVSGSGIDIDVDASSDAIRIEATGGGGTVTSVDITPGTLIDSSGGPITTSGSITVDVDLSEATEAVYTPSTDYLLFLDGGTTGTAAKESGIDFASALAGTGLTASSGVINRDTVALTTDTSGDYVATITGGTGIDSSGATSGEGISHTLSIDLGEVSAVVFNPATDYIPIIDGSATGSTQKDSWSDIANAIAGTGITASSGVLNADNLGTVTSVDIIAGTLIDSSGGPITGSGAITVNVDLSEATELPFAPSTDYILFLDGGATGTAAKESWTDLANSIAGTGLTASSGVLNADLTGTGVNNRVTLWSGTSSLDSSANLTFDGTLFTVEGEIRVTGAGASYDFEYDPTYGTASIAEILEFASGELRIGPIAGYTDSGGAGNIPTQTRLTSGTNHTDFFVYDPTSPATTRYVLKTNISSPTDEGVLVWENSTDSVKFITASNSITTSGFIQLVNDEGVPDAYDFYGYNGVSKGWHEIKSFKTFTVTDTDSGYTWSETGSAVASTTTGTITLVSGSGIDIDVDTSNDAIRIESTGGGGSVTSVDITPGTLIDSSGGPITTSGSITVDVDLTEATEAVYTPSTDYLLFLDGGALGSAAKESGVDFAAALAGTGLTASSGVINRDIVALTTDTSGDYVATITGGTGIDSSGATSGEGISHTLSIDLGEVSAVVFDPATDYIPIIDGSATGTTQKDAWADIASAIAGTGISASGGVLSADNLGTVTGTGTNDRVAVWSGTSSLDSSANLTFDGTLLTVGGDITVTSTGPSITQQANATGAARGLNNWQNWDGVSAYDNVVRIIFSAGTGNAAPWDLQSHNGSTWQTLIRVDADGAQYHRLQFIDGFETTGQGLFADGATGNPGIAFDAEQNTGFYRPGAGRLGLSVTGSQILDADSTSVEILGDLQVTGAGSSYDFEYDSTYGAGSIAEILEYAAGELRIGPTSGFTDSGGSGNRPTQTRISSGVNHTDFFLNDGTDTRYVVKTDISSPTDEGILVWETSTDAVKFVTASNSITTSGFIQLVNDEGVPDAYDFYGYNGVSKGWYEIKSFKTFTVTDTDSGHSWTDTGSAVADTTTDTITFVSGSGIDIDVSATTDAIRIQATGGGGNVSNTGTPVNDQIAVWTNATTIEGTTGISYVSPSFRLRNTNPQLAFLNASGTGTALIQGHDSNGLYIKEQVHGAPVTITGETSVGAEVNLIKADPDSDVKLYHASVETFRTQDNNATGHSCGAEVLHHNGEWHPVMGSHPYSASTGGLASTVAAWEEHIGGIFACAFTGNITSTLPSSTDTTIPNDSWWILANNSGSFNHTIARNSNNLIPYNGTGTNADYVIGSFKAVKLIKISTGNFRVIPYG